MIVFMTVMLRGVHEVIVTRNSSFYPLQLSAVLSESHIKKTHEEEDQILSGQRVMLYFHPRKLPFPFLYIILP